MANEVFNYLSITGNNGCITKLQEAARYDITNSDESMSAYHRRYGNELFSFIRLYPFPDDINSTMSVRIDWSYEHWGTDADVYGVHENINQSELWKIQFVTRWVPPLPALQKISSNYFGLLFELYYWSFDSSFQGDAIFKDGICLLDERSIWVPEEYKDIDVPELRMHPFIFGSIIN